MAGSRLVAWWCRRRRSGGARSSRIIELPRRANYDVPDALGLIGQIFDRMFAPSAPAKKEPSKILGENVTLTDLFNANERYYKKGAQRIW